MNLLIRVILASENFLYGRFNIRFKVKMDVRYQYSDYFYRPAEILQPSMAGVSFT
jgi:hypothetical protein